MNKKWPSVNFPATGDSSTFLNAVNAAGNTPARIAFPASGAVMTAVTGAGQKGKRKKDRNKGIHQEHLLFPAAHSWFSPFILQKSNFDLQTNLWHTERQL